MSKDGTPPARGGESARVLTIDLEELTWALNSRDPLGEQCLEPATPWAASSRPATDHLAPAPQADRTLSLLSLQSSPAMETRVGTLTIRNLEDPLKSRLRLRAAARNRSMEEEARQILRAALQETAAPTEDLGSRIRARFAPLGDIQLALEPREPPNEPPLFDDSAPAPPAKLRKPGAGRR